MCRDLYNPNTESLHKVGRLNKRPNPVQQMSTSPVVTGFFNVLGLSLSVKA